LMAQTTKRNEFSFGNAFNIRQDRVIEEAGGYQAIVSSVAKALYEKHGDALLTIDFMRKAGGWSALIAGEKPEPEANEIGMPTNPEWFLWNLRSDFRFISFVKSQVVALSRGNKS
jgi:hypothetical protein